MTQLMKSQAAALAAVIDERERKLREALRDELRRSGNEHYAELAGAVHDLADEAVADELIDIENALIQRHVQELRALEGARQRLVGGTIADCVACEGEIGYKRLLANPAAARCVACQEVFERTHAHEARPRL